MCKQLFVPITTLWDSFRKISADELMADFAGVHFRADIALERVKLEDGLIGFLQQMLGITGKPVVNSKPPTSSH